MRFLFVYCVGPGGTDILKKCEMSSLLPSSSSSFVFIYNLWCVYLCKIRDAAYGIINGEVGRNKAKVPRQDGGTLLEGISLDWRLEGNRRYSLSGYRGLFKLRRADEVLFVLLCPFLWVS